MKFEEIIKLVTDMEQRIETSFNSNLKTINDNIMDIHKTQIKHGETLAALEERVSGENGIIKRIERQDEKIGMNNSLLKRYGGFGAGVACTITIILGILKIWH